MAIVRKKFSSQVKPEVLESFKRFAEREGKQFQIVLEEAMLEYLEKRNGEMRREGESSHFKASIDRNYPLGEMIAEKHVPFRVDQESASAISNSISAIARKRREAVVAELKEFTSRLDLHKLSDPTKMVLGDRER